MKYLVKVLKYLARVCEIHIMRKQKCYDNLQRAPPIERLTLFGCLSSRNAWLTAKTGMGGAV